VTGGDRVALGQSGARGAHLHGRAPRDSDRKPHVPDGRRQRFELGHGVGLPQHRAHGAVCQARPPDDLIALVHRRTFERFGEAPELAAAFSTYVRGLQGPALGADTGSVLATAKHWNADGGTLNGRDGGDAPLADAGDDGDLR
jgi:hypothetical protein